LQFKLRNHKGFVAASLQQSILIHLGIILIFYALARDQAQGPSKQLDIEIRENPKAVPQAVNISAIKPSVPSPVKARAVFGLTRRSLSSESGIDTKLGNTIAKESDHEVLKPNDPDALPVPTEDYLVTEMPSLAEEVRIPYPPGPKKQGIEGAVVMDLLIDSSGQVREVREVKSPDPELRDAALSAVKNFKFKPGKIQNQAIAVRIRYAYRFVIEH